MLNKGSKLKFLIATLVVVLVVIIASTGNDNNPDQTSTAPLPAIRVSNPNSLPVKIENDINLNIPSELSTFSYAYKPFSESDAKNISVNLGLTGEPTRVEDINEGLKLIWSNQQYSFITTLKASHIKYSAIEFRQGGVGTQQPEDDLKNVALEFLSSKFNIDKSTLNAHKVKYLKKNPSTEGGFVETPKNSAQLIQVDVNHNSLNYLLLTDIPQQPLMFVQFTPNGEIYRSESYLLENIISSNKSFPTKTIEDIKSNISQATLISIENDYLASDNIKGEDITNIEIDKIELGYFFDKYSHNKELIPLFLLSGKITIKNSTGNYARLYMPAYK